MNELYWTVMGWVALAFMLGVMGGLVIAHLIVSWFEQPGVNRKSTERG